MAEFNSFSDAYKYILDQKKRFADTQYGIEHGDNGTQRYAIYDPNTYMKTKQNYMPSVEGARVKAPYTSGVYNDKEKATLDEIHNDAQKAYDWLYNNGYEQSAEKLGNMSLGDASNYVNGTLAKTQGKTKVRDIVSNYMRGLYGLTDDQINNQLTYNDNTGEVSFGGILIPKEYYSEYDNQTWTDNPQGVYDILEQYAKNNDLHRSEENIYKESLENQQKYLDTYDKDIHSNPYATDWGKNIMNTYGLYGQSAAENAAASRAASNGGNLDSFAAQAATNAQNEQIGKGHEQIGNMYKMVTDASGNLVDKSIASSDSIANNYKTRTETDLSKDLTDSSLKDSEVARTGNQNTEDLKANNPYLRKDEKGNYVLSGSGLALGDIKGEVDNFYSNTMPSLIKDIANSSGTQRLQKISDLYDQMTNANNMSIARDVKLQTMADQGQDVSGYGSSRTTTLPSYDKFKELFTNLTDAELTEMQNNSDYALQQLEGDQKSALSAQEAEQDLKKAEAEQDLKKAEAAAKNSSVKSSGTTQTSSEQIRKTDGYKNTVKDMKNNGLLLVNPEGVIQPITNKTTRKNIVKWLDDNNVSEAVCLEILAQCGITDGSEISGYLNNSGTSGMASALGIGQW